MKVLLLSEREVTNLLSIEEVRVAVENVFREKALGKKSRLLHKHLNCQIPTEKQVLITYQCMPTTFLFKTKKGREKGFRYVFFCVCAARLSVY